MANFSLGTGETSILHRQAISIRAAGREVRLFLKSDAPGAEALVKLIQDHVDSVSFVDEPERQPE